MKTSRLSTALFYFVNLAAVLYMYRIEVYGVNVSLVRIVVLFLGGYLLFKAKVFIENSRHVILLIAPLLLLRAADVFRTGADEVTIRTFWNYGSLMVLFLSVYAMLRSPEEILGFMKSYVFVSLVPLGISAFQDLTGHLPFEELLRERMSEDLQMLSFRSSSELIQEGLELTRWAASFYDPNFYGFYLLGVLAFCLALYQSNRVNRTALLVLMGLNVVSLFMTLSRTATVGLLVLLAFSGYYLAGIKKLVLISLPVLLGLFVVVSLLTDPLWQERAMQRLSLSPEASGTSLGDSFGRQQYFDAALEAFGSSKMVGVGSTGLSRISGVAYGSGHNVYLTWLARYGLVGFCLSMPFLLYPFRALRIGRKSPLAMYAFVALGLTTATMVTYMAYDYFDLLEPQYIAFAVIYAIIDRTLGSPSSKRSFVRPSAAPRTEVPVAVRIQAPEVLAESSPKAAQ